MGAVRRFPSTKKWPKIEKPCVPASRHNFQVVDRRRSGDKGGDYLLTLRCLHCANSVMIQTKPYTNALRKPPTKKERRAWANLTNGVQ